MDLLVQIIEMSFMSFYLSDTLYKDDIHVPLSSISKIVKSEKYNRWCNLIYLCIEQTKHNAYNYYTQGQYINAPFSI